ncbi:hypothetical protein NMG60_11030992 [Bertholletia excelsa]
MQAVSSFIAPSSFLRPTIPSKSVAATPPARGSKFWRPAICHPVRVNVTPNDSSTVDYSSMSSVFPAEACETVGGDACDVQMYPEVKLSPEDKEARKTPSEGIEREYLEYNTPKTVFPGEACDDLGGEFCEPEYQQGVY